MSSEEAHPNPSPMCRRLAELALDPTRPLVVTDADEVVAHFLSGLERFLAGRDLWLDLQSYALHGNIKHRRTDAAVEAAEVHRLLVDFFQETTTLLEPVTGAADALGALATKAQIVVLSNVPVPYEAARVQWLKQHGMDYPLVCNVGLKGPAVRELASRMQAPVFFIDDIPHNIISVMEAAPEVTCLHFVADPRLARLVPPAEGCHYRGASWPEVRRFIEAEIERAALACPR